MKLLTIFVSLAYVVTLAMASWSTAQLSQARYALSATSVAQIVLFAGGINASSGETDRVDIYTSSADIWTSASLSLARYWMAAASVGTLAMFAGGAYGGNHTATVDVFNAQTLSWSESNGPARILQVGRYRNPFQMESSRSIGAGNFHIQERCVVVWSGFVGAIQLREDSIS